MLEIGLSHTSEEKVTKDNIAKTVGSGNLYVYATPSMVALMENAALNAVNEHLAEGSTTVGVKLDVNHIKATPLDATIMATAKLEVIEGRKLVFEVTAVDEYGLIGEGRHERFIVDEEKFMSKINNNQDRK